MTFEEFISRVVATFNGNVATMIVTIAILFALFYFTIKILSGNNAYWVIFVFVIYVVATGTIFMMADISGWDYFIVPLLFIVAIVAMFATEIKREIWKFRPKKKSGEVKSVEKGSRATNTDKYVNEIIKAILNMSKNNVGAIIIFANDNLDILMPFAQKADGLISFAFSGTLRQISDNQGKKVLGLDYMTNGLGFSGFASGGAKVEFLVTGVTQTAYIRLNQVGNQRLVTTFMNGEAIAFNDRTTGQLTYEYAMESTTVKRGDKVRVSAVKVFSSTSISLNFNLVLSSYPYKLSYLIFLSCNLTAINSLA